jgi:hypothetical protein
MFNRENIAQAQVDFTEKRYCVIDDILEDRYIQALHNSVTELPYQVRAKAGDKQFTSDPNFYNSDQFASTLQEYIEHAKGKFSYFHNVFVAAKDKRLHSNPLVTEFNHVVTEDYSIVKPDYTFYDLASEVTGFPNMVAKNGNYGYYDYQSWLKVHNDVRRWCAYIFYFNKTWEPDWGGQLCILDGKEIKDSILPYGNRLVLMDVSKVDINTHFVSPVSIGADHPRYSLSGWFYQKDKDGPGPEKRLTNP